MKLFNGIDEIYQQELITLPDGRFECPVCGRTYKRQGAAQDHLLKQDCHSYRNIFYDTNAEPVLLNIYTHLLSINRGSRKPTMRQLRACKQYNQIARFYLFCYQHQLPRPLDYLMYVLENTRWKTPYVGLSYAIKESMLTGFQEAKKEYCDDAANEDFWTRHEDQIQNDNNFVLRALEKGEIHISYLFSKLDVDAFFDRLSIFEQERLDRFLSTVVGEAA